MYRDSKFTQRRSMRISVQKYLEQRGDAQPRQQVEQQRNSAAPRPAFFPVPADDNEAGPSGNRDNGNPIDRNLIERQPGSDRANAVAAPVEEAAAPAQQLHAAGADLQPQAEPAPPRGNRGNPPRGSRNRGAGYYDGYRQPQRNRPAPAPMAAPRQVEVVIPENERAQSGNNRNEQYGRGDDAFVVPYYHPVRYQGRGNNKRSSVEYRVRLSERLLPLKNLTAARARKIPSDDFHLVAEKGEAFSCAKGLLQSMCSCLDLSDRWDVNSLPIPCDAEGVMTIITFAKKGTISFKKDSSVIKIIRAADFLGFESLLRVCITHVSGPYYPAEFIIEIHARLSHIDGIPEIFSQRLGELPLQVFDAKTEVPQNLLSSLNIEQLQKLLRDDNLQVASEDYAVYLILQWMQAQKFDTKDKQAEMEELCFKHIRYPFITRCVQNLLKENSLNFTKERIVSNECLSESCRPRSGYDKHVHILWKQYRANRNGSSTFGVSCVTWNKNTQRKILERNRERNQDENQEENKFPVEERELSSIPNEQHPYEDHRCTQFTATGNKIVKMSCNRAHNRIFVHELNMQNSTVERRGRILLGRGDPYVDRPDPIVLKGTSDLTICYYDSGIKMTSYDPNTWRAKDFPTEEVRRLPMYPFEWGIFDDCAVAINSSRIVISEVDFTGAVEVELPYINGRFIDMERIGDHLFVLTDNAASRIVNQNSSDEIQVIDLKEKKLVRTSQLPAYPEDPWISRRNWDEFNDAVLRFAKIESELYVVCQRDRLTPLHIVSLDTVTYTSEVVASVVLPKPDESDPSSIHARSYLCGVPLGIVPCDKTPLRDLVNVPRPE